MAMEPPARAARSYEGEGAWGYIHTRLTMTNDHEDIQEFLRNLPDEYDILEQGIDAQVQEEYLGYSHRIERGELAEAETIALGSILFKAGASEEARKKALTLLAHMGTVAAFRWIEKYRNAPDEGMEQWAALALMECRMFLESTLTDQSTGFITSGLGGRDGRLRYYFLVLSATGERFTGTQEDIMGKEAQLVAKGLNSIVESFAPSGTFAGLTVLIPMDVAVGTFIETVIEKCNELGGFVFEHYYVTNQHVPDGPEIEEIINKVRE